MGEKDVPFGVKFPKLERMEAELAEITKFASIPSAKLKLMGNVFKNMSEVAKESGGMNAMNEMFSSMKEGSMITAPWNMFIKLLQMESTRESVESIKSLMGMLSDPATRGSIDLLSSAVGGWMASINNIFTAINNLTGALGIGETGLEQFKAGVELALTPFPLHLANMENTLNKLRITLGLTVEEGERFMNILNIIIGIITEFGDRREGMGEGFVPKKYEPIDWEGEGYGAPRGGR